MFLVKGVPQAVSGRVWSDAVELVRSSGRPIRQIAREPRVSYEPLHYGLKQAEIDTGEREG